MTAAVTTDAPTAWPNGLAADLVAVCRRLGSPSQRQTPDSGYLPLGFRKAQRLLDSREWTTRLGAIRALTAFADSQPGLRQIAIDALCAYLRRSHSPGFRVDQDWRLRANIVRLIADRLKPATGAPWRGHDFDFSGAVFDGGSFANADFAGGRVSFAGARFTFRRGIAP
jgi:hypothetical protein